MGNNACCQERVAEFQKMESKNQIRYETNEFKQLSQYSPPEQPVQQILIPDLSPQVLKVLKEHNPFQKEFSSLKSAQKVYALGTDIFQGQLDQFGKPTNLGKMYKANGCLFIGHFASGKAQGSCFYIFKDGSYYKGEMKNNLANTLNGKFVTKNLEYTGGFQNNQFHGQSKQIGIGNFYYFEGIYEKGKKKRGVMKWGVGALDNIYEGNFDENGRFIGKGKWKDPEGVYEGDFLNGEKHGQGIYCYKSKLRYQGHYEHNRKQGQGKIINNDGSLAYKGIFKDGLPNGKGIAMSKSGIEFQGDWIDGIDARML